MKFLHALNSGLERLLQDRTDTCLLGEDILDPYGGAFKVTRGLSSRFPERVMGTPISEAGMTGVAVGMALQGMRPVVEIMFGDFLTLCLDQVLNHMCKYPDMFGRHVDMPVTIRTPMGGGRGYGPTHSQSLEKHFLGIPGLRVVAPNTLTDPGAMLHDLVVNGSGPTLFLEHKLLYARELTLPEGGRMGHWRVEHRSGTLPEHLLTLADFRACDVTVACYGHAADLVREAAERLYMEREIRVEVFVPSALKDFDQTLLLESLARSRTLLTVEEGTRTLGWGAEVGAGVLERLPGGLQAFHRIAAKDGVISACRETEADSLPSVDAVVRAVERLV